MPRVLHIRTRTEDSLADKIAALQSEKNAEAVAVFDLAQPDPDYGKLLEEIFASDSVAVW